MKDFDHFIITRFNLRSESFSLDDKRNKKTLQKDWMDHRFNLFKQFCLPSLKNQSNKNFKWLIYFDQNTDKYYKEEFNKISQLNDFLIVKYVDGYSQFLKKYKDDLNDLRDNDNKYIITTRFDNDDCFHCDAIAVIQKQFNYQEYMAVNFIKGYQLQIEPRYYLYKNYSFSNPFVSLIEKINRDDFNGCYSKQDRFWNENGKILQIADKEYWLQIIHERNLLNTLSGIPVITRKNLFVFGIQDKIKPKFKIIQFLFFWDMPLIKWFKVEIINRIKFLVNLIEKYF